MAILDELVTQIENPDLRARIAAEVEKLAKQKKFGLVFEEHLPECTPLWDIPVKAGRKAALEYSARDCAARPLKLSIHSGGIEHACRRR